MEVEQQWWDDGEIPQNFEAALELIAKLRTELARRPTLVRLKSEQHPVDPSARPCRLREKHILVIGMQDTEYELDVVPKDGEGLALLRTADTVPSVGVTND